MTNVQDTSNIEDTARMLIQFTFMIYQQIMIKTMETTNPSEFFQNADFVLLKQFNTKMDDTEGSMKANEWLKGALLLFPGGDETISSLITSRRNHFFVDGIITKERRTTSKCCTIWEETAG